MWAFCNSNEGLLFDNNSSSDDLVNITLISNHSLILMIRDLKTIFVSEINFVTKQTLATRILLTRSPLECRVLRGELFSKQIRQVPVSDLCIYILPTVHSWLP